MGCRINEYIKALLAFCLDVARGAALMAEAASETKRIAVYGIGTSTRGGRADRKFHSTAGPDDNSSDVQICYDKRLERSTVCYLQCMQC